MEPTHLSYVVIGAALCFLTRFAWRRILNKRPPSPFLRLPVIGHLYLIKPPFTDIFVDLANRYGPVLLLRFGWRKVLIISSGSAAEECLTKNDVVFCNRPSGFLTGKYVGYDYTSLNFAPYGPHWKNLRKITALEVLSNQRLQSLAFIRASEARLLVNRLFRLCVACPWEGRDIKSLFYDTTLNIMTMMIFGNRYFGEGGDESEQLKHLVAETIRHLNTESLGDFVPYLRWLDWGVKRGLREYYVKREVLLTRLVESHRRNWQLDVSEHGPDSKPKPKPMIQVLLELQESDPNYYKDDLIRGIILDLMAGASETTTSTLDWAFSLLLNHQEVLKKAQAEIDDHVGHERLLEEADLSQLPYLRCIINETLRMYPPVPFLLPRESSDDCVVQGYRIPRHTMLQINVHTIQNDPTIWDDPESFRPERFVGVEGHRIGYKMFPFGAGRRSCPGEGLAIRVTGLTIGTLIQCFEWERIDENKLLDLTKFDSFNLQRALPLQARIQPRKHIVQFLEKL